jgi:hypothetical protein
MDMWSERLRRGDTLSRWYCCTALLHRSVASLCCTAAELTWCLGTMWRQTGWQGGNMVGTNDGNLAAGDGKPVRSLCMQVLSSGWMRVYTHTQTHVLWEATTAASVRAKANRHGGVFFLCEFANARTKSRQEIHSLPRSMVL